MSVIVVDELVVAPLPMSVRTALTLVRRPARPCRRPAGLAADAVLEAIDAAGPDAIVLARPPERDADAALVQQVADLLRVRAVRLPGSPEAAAWVAGVAAAWVAAGEEGLVRRLEVAASVADGECRLPSLDTDGCRRPSLRLPVLARWAGCAWTPCGRCRGGGLPQRCGACGAVVPVPA